MTSSRGTSQSAGLAAMVAVVLCLSSSSSIIRKSGAPGVTLALWRMGLATLIWHGVLLASRRRVTAAQWRRAALPGFVFGCNIALFFTAISHTSVAHAEFIGNLSPIVIVPLGAVVFHERIPTRALPWAVVPLVGVALVLLFSPKGGAATATGDLIAVAAVVSWAGYLLTTKRMRGDMDVAQFMAAVGPYAFVTVLPLSLARGGTFDLDGGDVLTVVLLAVLTGTIAHGLIVFAQHHLAVGTISTLQVAQPALAICWAYLLLGEELRVQQVVGGILVITGLALFVRTAQVRVRRDEVVLTATPE